MTKIRVESDGTTEGTKVFLADGTEIASEAYAVQVNIGQEGPPHVVLTYLLGGMQVSEESAPSAAAPVDDAVARHNARKL